ncbi:MAG: four helix bundle protein [bacterium]|nr:four helix bundle protein [bacterium]
MEHDNYLNKLREKMDDYVHFIYALTKKFPKEELYGSLKESKYLLYFSLVEKYITKEDYKKGDKMAEEIGAMLWRAIEPLGR